MKNICLLVILMGCIAGCGCPKDDAKQDPGATAAKQPVDQDMMQRIRTAKKSGIK